MYSKGEDGKQYPKPIVRDEQRNPLLQMAVEKIEKELWVNEETGEIILGQGALQPYQLNQKVGTPPPSENDDSADKWKKRWIRYLICWRQKMYMENLIILQMPMVK